MVKGVSTKADECKPVGCGFVAQSKRTAIFWMEEIVRRYGNITIIR